MVHKTPFVIAKTAMTLDGKMAAYNGHSKWVTGAESRQTVHYLRNEVDSILVGIGTVLADDPMLDHPDSGGWEKSCSDYFGFKFKNSTRCYK